MRTIDRMNASSLWMELLQSRWPILLAPVPASLDMRAEKTTRRLRVAQKRGGTARASRTGVGGEVDAAMTRIHVGCSSRPCKQCTRTRRASGYWRHWTSLIGYCRISRSTGWGGGAARNNDRSNVHAMAPSTVAWAAENVRSSRIGNFLWARVGFPKVPRKLRMSEFDI